MLPIPSKVYGCVSDEETADMVYGNKPSSYFLPVYIFGSIDNRLVVIQYCDAYDLAEHRKIINKLDNVPSIYQLMQEKLKPEIIKKFGIQLNKNEKTAGIYFNPENETAIKEFIWKNCGWDPLLHIDNNQEMIEKAAGIHN